MLHIFFGDMPNVVYNTSMYFDNSYLDSWLESEFTKKVIKAIDKGVLIGTKAVETKALGVIPVTQLSGGTKTLILMYHEPHKIFNASTCGDNCAKFILKAGKEKDITINLYHLMDFGNKDFEIEIVNTGVVVHNMKELILNAGDLI